MNFKSHNDSRYENEINLQVISQRFFDGYEELLFDDNPSLGYPELVWGLAHELNLWRPKSEVKKELALLIRNESFWQTFKPHSSFGLKRNLLKQAFLYKNYFGPELIEEEDYCIHYFSDVKITRDQSDFDFFFALMISSKGIMKISDFLAYQLINTFDNKIEDYVMFLKSLVVNHRRLIKSKTEEVIEKWINYKLFLIMNNYLRSEDRVPATGKIDISTATQQLNTRRIKEAIKIYYLETGNILKFPQNGIKKFFSTYAAMANIPKAKNTLYQDFLDIKDEAHRYGGRFGPYLETALDELIRGEYPDVSKIGASLLIDKTKLQEVQDRAQREIKKYNNRLK